MNPSFYCGHTWIPCTSSRPPACACLSPRGPCRTDNYFVGLWRHFGYNSRSIPLAFSECQILLFLLSPLHVWKTVWENKRETPSNVDPHYTFVIRAIFLLGVFCMEHTNLYFLVRVILFDFPCLPPSVRRLTAALWKLVGKVNALPSLCLLLRSRPLFLAQGPVLLTCLGLLIKPLPLNPLSRLSVWAGRAVDPPWPHTTLSPAALADLKIRT